MAIVTNVYKNGAKHVLLDPKSYDAGERHDINIIYSYDGGKRTIVYVREAVVLTTTATRWDSVSVSWTLNTYVPDEFVLYRNNVVIYRGPNKSYSDANVLNPGTTYTYKIEVYADGQLTSTATKSVTTPVRANMVLTATASAWDRVALSWTDPSGGSIDNYTLKRSTTQIYSGTGKSHTDTGRAASTKYTYTVEAKRSGVVISSATASATTPARPKTYGTLSFTTRSGWRWNQSTGTNPVVYGFNVPRAIYVYRIRFQCGGYYAQGKNTQIKPVLGGWKASSWHTTGPESGSDSGWTDYISIPDVSLAAGTRNIGFERSTAYPTQWDYGSGGDSHVLYELGYWYYT